MNEARQTPLPDLLDQVPEDIVLGIPGDEPVFPSYTHIPIGKHARQAAAELRRLAAVEAQRDALLEALRYWLPDETMIPAGHEAKWNEAVAAIKAVEGEKS